MTKAIGIPLPRLTGVELRVSEIPESSALGATLAGLLGLGFYRHINELADLPREANAYHRELDTATVNRLHNCWRR
jgi:glycerol kinase